MLPSSVYIMALWLECLSRKEDSNINVLLSLRKFKPTFLTFWKGALTTRLDVGAESALLIFNWAFLQLRIQDSWGQKEQADGGEGLLPSRQGTDQEEITLGSCPSLFHLFYPVTFILNAKAVLTAGCGTSDASLLLARESIGGHYLTSQYFGAGYLRLGVGFTQLLFIACVNDVAPSFVNCLISK